MAQPKLIVDVELMRQLQQQKCFPKESFRIDLPVEDIALLLMNCYVMQVRERNREFVHDEHTERQIINIARILATPSHKFGILLSGQCGNGKTTMLYAIRTLIHYLYSKKGYCLPSDLKSEIPIVSAKQVIEEVMSSDKLAYRHQDILMIDDLGHEPTEVVNYGMVYTPVVDLLEARYDRMKYTIISTNLPPNEIRPKYKNRLADRFNEMMNFVEFTGESYRVI